jgi:acyl-coenzyme A synthetase/AMP-(fatty) acid ligase
MLSIIQKNPENLFAIIGEDYKYKYQDLCEIGSHYPELLEKIKDRNIALSYRETDFFAALLPTLDSTANQILFLPDSIENNVKEVFLKKANIELELKINRTNIQVLECGSDFTAPEQNEETGWIIPTTGTTGTPKLVRHTFNSLTRTSKNNREVGATICWGLTYEINRFAGLQVYLQSIISGSRLIIPNTNSSFNSKISFFAKNRCNALSATPTYWRKILMTPIADQLSLRYITIGGEIADQTLLNMLKNKYPEAKISHIYASTEAGVGFSVSDGIQGFPLDYLRSGVSGADLRINEDNILLIKPLKTVQKYLSDKSIVDKDGFINTGDRIKIEQDRCYFMGRDSGSINVGGNKVMPEEIESCILEMPEISVVKAFGIKNSIMGSIVSVNIIASKSLKTATEKKLLKKKIIEHCNKKLDPFKVPNLIKFVEKIEINESGKIKR